MNSPALDHFIAQAIACSRATPEPADCVLAIAPLMLDLIANAGSFLQPQHYRADPDHYARNLIFEAMGDGLSLYALVWSPGQWTPVHDHGSWGVGASSRACLKSAATCACHPIAVLTSTSSWCAAA